MSTEPLSVTSGPQSHAAIADPKVILVVRPAFAQGNRIMPLPFVALLMPVTITWMPPSALVAIEGTYLDTGVPVLDSQPQLPGLGRTDDDCVDSVTLVRQADAARMPSDIFARAGESLYAGNATAARIPRG